MMEVSGAALTANATTSEVATTKLAENFDTFLTLLTTQLKNQDPLEPTDSNEFVRQLTQFSQVEQSITTNKSLEQLLDLQNTNQAVSAIGYIGNTVEALGNIAPLQDGMAKFSYALDQESKGTTIVIHDANGSFVASATGETGIGKHVFTWDGLDKNGQAVPEGNYTISVSAKNIDGEDIDAPTSVFGKVTSIESSAEGALLSLGGVNVPLTFVLSVSPSKVPQT